MEERGVLVDHATIQLGGEIQPPIGGSASIAGSGRYVSWRMDETYIKVKGQWYYLYRAVDKHGQKIDFLLTEHRDKKLRYDSRRRRSAGMAPRDDYHRRQ